jgi:hypothetical protein
MIRAGLPYLLILLLVTAWVDDAAAAATPNPTDDLCSLQDNEYLPPPVRVAARRVPSDSLPPGTPPVGQTLPAPAVPARLPGPAAAPDQPPLLYVLMSLQC